MNEKMMATASMVEAMYKVAETSRESLRCFIYSDEWWRERGQGSGRKGKEMEYGKKKTCVHMRVNIFQNVYYFNFPNTESQVDANGLYDNFVSKQKGQPHNAVLSITQRHNVCHSHSIILRSRGE